MFLWPSDKEVSNVLVEKLNIAIDLPEALMIKAIDVETNEIAAWALWQLSDYREEKDAKIHPQYFGAAGAMLPTVSGGDILEIPRDALARYIGNQFKTFYDT